MYVHAKAFISKGNQVQCKFKIFLIFFRHLKQKHPLLDVFNEVLKVSTYKNNLVLAILNIYQLIIAVLTSNLVPKYVSFLGYLDWYCNLVSFYS